MINPLHIILQNELALLFVILTAGSILGKVKIAGVELSASGGVLFIALLFGHFQYDLPEQISSIGFAFFIYAIGFGAGPRFFQTFKKNGVKFGLVALFVALIASAVAFIMVKTLQLPLLVIPGVLGGALTSTSTLAAAYELIQDPIMSVSYGISYPFGLLGLLVMIQILPRILGINLKQEAHQMKVGHEEDDDELTYQKRVYNVQNPGLLEIPLRDINLRKLTGVGIVSIKRKDKIMQAHADSVLHYGDHVLAEGKLKNLLELGEYIGPEIEDDDIIERQNTSATVIVTRKKVLRKSLRELRLAQDLGVIFTRFQRDNVEMPVDPDFKLERGDVVTITGDAVKVKYAISLIGRQDFKKYETDIFLFSAGMLLGLLLGSVQIPVINASIGNAGGLLFMGIILGYMRHYGIVAGRVPLAARYILQELGLLLFLAGVGIKAGHSIMQYLSDSGLSIFVTGVMVTTVTLLSTLFFCRYLLKFDWNTSFGATTGGVTSTVALKIVTEKAESQYALLGYAGVYAFANILLTMLGQFLVQLT